MAIHMKVRQGTINLNKQANGSALRPISGSSSNASFGQPSGMST